jgi:hypothetical protein
MDELSELAAFSQNIVQDVIVRADSIEEGALRAEAFTEIFIGYLADAGEIDDGITCHFESRGMKCSGYYISDDGDRLDLFISVPRLSGEVDTIAASEVELAFKRLKTYLTRALTGIQGLEEASGSYDMARNIWLARGDLSRIRLFLLTDAIAKVDKIPNELLEDVELSFHVWDLRRVHRADVSGERHEPIEIDFARSFDVPIRCIVAEAPGGKYRSLFSILPGNIVVELYSRYGPRLLERNVRSFLQLKGKVNQGIRKTILEHPEMFLAFNNGLSVTATGLKVKNHGNGIADLQYAKDFQIVNGGQTTGSIYRAFLKDKADVSQLWVPVKITEIFDIADVEYIAPQISLSANSQNKVNIADFSANHPFHRKIEELSRTVWAPAPQGLQKQTKWFYERARGQYHDALAMQGTPQRRKAFEAAHPRRQVITKTDLAKFEQTWSQFPHLVSRGAQKCYLSFMDGLEQRGSIEPDENYFKYVMARCILFKETERIVSKQKFGGYRANIVTYTLAWLSYRTAKRIDIGAIWAAQALSPAIRTFIENICHFAHKHITGPPGGQNVTEWCKKDACWEKFKELQVELPVDLQGELLSREKPSNSPSHSADDNVTAEERELISSIGQISAQTWFNLAAWAKDTQSLQPWQRSLAYSLGRMASRKKEVSPKQAVQGKKIYEEAKRVGFRE